MKYQPVTKGLNGFTFINDTGAHTPPSGSNYFSAVQHVGGATDAVINNTGSTVSGAVDFDANITIGQGDAPLDGMWTSITLVSGAVIAYHE
jgi:hypothetical protein